MARSVFLFFLIFFLFGSCVYNEVSPSKTCNVNNPVEDLPWLKAAIAGYDQTSDYYKYLYVLKADYNNQTVFIFGSCCPFCNTVTPVTDCEGKFLFYRFDKEQSDFIKNEQVIWQARNSECKFM
jgi:hypothetical protein